MTALCQKKKRGEANDLADEGQNRRTKRSQPLRFLSKCNG